MRKRFYYQVFNPANEYLGVWHSDVISEPKFRYGINTPPGEMRVKLARRIDSFGEAQDVSLGNKVIVYSAPPSNDAQVTEEILVSESSLSITTELGDQIATSLVSTVSGVQATAIYCGYITAYEQVLVGKQEQVSITLLGAGYDLNNYLIRDASSNTTVTYSGVAHSVIMKDLLDNYIADGGLVRYTEDSIEDTGTTTTYTFRAQTVLEGIRKLVELAPEGWYFVIRPDGYLYFRQTNKQDADHSFVIGRDIETMESRKSIEELINKIYFIGGDTGSGVSLYKKFERTGSIATNGERAVKITDLRVTDVATAESIATRILDDFDTPITRVTVGVIDRFQDAPIGSRIEDVLPGQSMRIQNISFGMKTTTLWDVAVWDEDVWDYTISSTLSDILQVKNVSYEPDGLIIEAADRLPDLARRLESVAGRAEDASFIMLPNTPS